MTPADTQAAEHLPLAERRARRLAAECGLPEDEAVSAALLGLAEAIERYEPGLGPLAPFACRTIDGRVRQAGRDWRWRRRGAAQPGRELAAGDDLMSMVPDRLATVELAEARTDIAHALAALTRVEREVVLLHGKADQSLGAVAVALGIEYDHARYLWRRALEKMREQLGVGR